MHIDSDGDEESASRARRRDEMHIDRRLVGIASAQHGNITRAQLLAGGLGPRAIDSWLARGRLQARHRGVYVLGHTALPVYSAEMAAILACAPRSVISHGSAGHMWRIRPKPRDGIDVTVVGRNLHDRAGIKIHRVTTLMRTDLRRVERIPITSPARTVLDLTPDLDDRELELMVHEAIALRLVTVPQINAVLARYPRRRGSARLKELADPSVTLTVTDSGGAERLHQHIRRSGLPQPRVDYTVGHWRPDFYWPEAGLVVELDGGDFHSTRARIERDHRKDIELRAMGISVLRFTGRQVVREIEFVLVALARAYERRLVQLGASRAAG